MSVNCSPFGPKPAFFLSSGIPAVGGLLFSYVAGSVNTKQNTYTDSTGASANPNPIVLNVLGEPTNELWLTSGLGYKFVYAPSTDTDPPTSPIWSIDNLRGINDTTVSFNEWVAGPTPTFVAPTQFTLVGDQTGTFTVGRRVKTTNTGGTVYSTISVSAFAAVTTITVVNDSGVLDAGLSAVEYGILQSVNVSIPTYAGKFTTINASGAVTLQTTLGVTQNIRPSAATASIADDTAVSFTPPITYGIIMIISDSNYDNVGLVSFNTVNGQGALIAGSAQLQGANGTLAGTTGADTFLTVSAANDGKIYIENRRGSAQTVRYILFGGAV